MNEKTSNKLFKCTYKYKVGVQFKKGMFKHLKEFNVNINNIFF